MVDEDAPKQQQKQTAASVVFSKQQRDCEAYVAEHKIDETLDEILNEVLAKKPEKPLSAIMDLLFEKLPDADKSQMGKIWKTQAQVPQHFAKQKPNIFGKEAREAWQKAKEGA